MSHSYICSHLRIKVQCTCISSDPCSCVYVIVFWVMKQNVGRAVIALRLLSWALDQKIAGFNSKISREIWAGEVEWIEKLLSKSLGEKFFEPSAALLPALEHSGCFGQIVDGECVTNYAWSRKPQQASWATVLWVNEGWTKVNYPILYTDLSLDSKLTDYKQEPQCSCSLLTRVPGCVAPLWIYICLLVGEEVPGERENVCFHEYELIWRRSGNNCETSPICYAKD